MIGSQHPPHGREGVGADRIGLRDLAMHPESRRQIPLRAEHGPIIVRQDSQLVLESAAAEPFGCIVLALLEVNGRESVVDVARWLALEGPVGQFECLRLPPHFVHDVREAPESPVVARIMIEYVHPEECGGRILVVSELCADDQGEEDDTDDAECQPLGLACAHRQPQSRATKCLGACQHDGRDHRRQWQIHAVFVHERFHRQYARGGSQRPQKHHP